MTPLEHIIRERIKTDGPITVADYMELCLAHPEHGYYRNRDPFGEAGDFTTAPEISQIFGELLGAWTAAYWQMSGKGPFAVIELGPGRGTLMRDFLRATAHVEGFHGNLAITMVETSPALTRLQRATLHQKHPRIRWLTGLDDLPAYRSVFLANEFFDALPIRQFVKTDGGLKEKLVDIDRETEELCFILQQMGLRLVKGGRYAGDDAIIESSPASRAIAGRIAGHVKRFGGAGLVIDYGYFGGSRGNTLQALKKHLFHPVLKDAGEADLTAHVDFDALAAVFAEAGLRVHGPVDQGPFLLMLGAEIRIKTLIERADPPQQKQLASGFRRLTDEMAMGALFKVMGFCDDPQLSLAGF